MQRQNPWQKRGSGLAHLKMLLPIHDVLTELRQQLACHSAVILSAPPGSGKTTVAPLALLDEPWLTGRTILLLEPRRIAARLAAAFMARQLGEEVGRTVGYRVRFESRVSPATRLEVVTEGVLCRRLQDDPELNGVGLVIFDEFHERSLQADLALALCLDVMAGLRDDLKILIMSATLDIEGLNRLLDSPPLVSASGRLYPVHVEYRPAGFSLPFPREIARQAAQCIHTALAGQSGDILAFLPGTAEIRQTHELLSASLGGSELSIQPLYGDLSLAAQTAAVQPDPHGKRRVILATPIAETSVTIEGIRVVVDSGFKRSPQFDPNSGLSRLTTQRVSLAAANQRTGRAGRLGPGHCYRLWNTGDEHALRPFDPPAIIDADLSQLVLDLARWGVHDPCTLRWLTPPPPGHFAQARDLLQTLGALDHQGRITGLGKKISELPLPPRLGCMLLRAAKRGGRERAMDLAALLSERDIIKGQERSADMEERLQALHTFRAQGPAAARACGADPEGCRRVLRTASQLRQLLTKTRTEETEIPAGSLLALAFPDRIAQRRPAGQGQYKLRSGRGARLPAHDPLASHPFLVVAELDAGEGEGRIHLAAPLERESLEADFAAQIRSRENVFWDGNSGQVKALRRQLLGELILDEAPLNNPAPEAVLAALLTGIRLRGLESLPWTNPAKELRLRMESIRAWQPETPWPDMGEAHLLATLEQWLAPFLVGMRTMEQLKKLDLCAILAAQLSWQQRQELDTLAPTHLLAPSGSRIPLRYSASGPPILAVRLQEMFGLAETPKICDNRVAVVLHLLSPAQRPIQITSDLDGFWRKSYHEVKKEMRGRYPKHHWPDDPWQARPTARTKKATAAEKKK